MRQLVLPPLFLLTLLLPAGAGGQEAGDTEPSYYESIDVQVVNVEVFVTGKSGQRISGLTREDFQLLEDGRPVEIRRSTSGSSMTASAATPRSGPTRAGAPSPP